MNRYLITFFLFVALTPFCQGAKSESIGIFAPYVGQLNSTYVNPAYHLDLNESGNMLGAYAQWINPQSYQANVFLYYAPSAGMTKVLGLHLNVDYYPVIFSYGKLVTGIDLERINIHTAGPLKGLESFELNNKVSTVMPRIGISLPVYSNEWIKLSAFPYAGGVYEAVSGDVSVDPMGPTPKRLTPISESSTYAALGLNLNIFLQHFFEIQAKYLSGLKSSGRLSSVDLLLNALITKNFAVSYRFKNVDLPKRSNQYHLVGLAMVI